MTLSLVLLCAAAAALIALGSSALVGAGMVMARSQLLRLTPAAEARVWLVAAFVPLLVAFAVMTAALAPSIGWIVDHCAPTFDAHVHPHICTDHHVGGLPAVTVWAFAGLLVLRLLWSGIQIVRGAIATVRTRRSLTEIAVAGAEPDVLLLPFEEPQAFVVGTLRPTLFVTAGLQDGAHQQHAATVLAHERAHVRRRDPLRRVAASVALAFHLPVIARWIERRLNRANEMASDAQAAEAVGSREAVARALVGITRAMRMAPRASMTFGGSDVEIRVSALLDPLPKFDRPQTAMLLSGIGAFFLIVGLSADAVHHGVEIVLGFISG